ncbi:MAG: hypothetical protein LQ346_004507 [Caloplaca aetnensis]|nr:MAG: hypothetical protein LQ346_004507 [Caloplaca aetnensis]
MDSDDSEDYPLRPTNRANAPASSEPSVSTPSPPRVRETVFVVYHSERNIVEGIVQIHRSKETAIAWCRQRFAPWADLHGEDGLTEIELQQRPLLLAIGGACGQDGEVEDVYLIQQATLTRGSTVTTPVRSMALTNGITHAVQPREVYVVFKLVKGMKQVAPGEWIWTHQHRLLAVFDSHSDGYEREGEEWEEVVSKKDFTERIHLTAVPYIQ